MRKMQERLTDAELLEHKLGTMTEWDVTRFNSLASAELLEARELIEEAAKQHCWDWAADLNNLMQLNSQRNKKCTRRLRYLASIGRLEIESDDGVRVVGRLKA